MAQEQQVLQGTVGAVVFSNEENGYTVLRLQCDDGQTVTVVGTIPQASVGEKLSVTGRWSSHPSYGKQFEAEFLERLLPQTESEILRYLSGRAVKGIGPVLATRIVHRFGADSLRIIESDPAQLATISGISRAKANAISENFRLQSGIRLLMEFFSAYSLPPELAIQLHRLYGDTARDVLQNDPYLLTEEELNCPFAQADHFALAQGVDPADPRRLEAAILHNLRLAAENGHSFLPEEKLIRLTTDLLDCREDPVLIAIDRLVEYSRLVRDFLGSKELIYLPQLHQAEVYCRQKLTHHGACRYPLPSNWNRVFSNVTGHGGLHYSKDQCLAMEQAVTQGLLLLTGGPGTGKTTVLRAVLELYEALDIKCVLAAPTGRAAKRLTEVTGREASTIHRLLEAGIDPFTGKMCFGRDESNKLKADAIILDEMSMVDLPLLHSLLLAVKAKTRLILVGDPDQLPPVGPGCPFRDCLKSETLPTVRLTEIFRQAQQSLIVMNAHRINSGITPELSRKDSDFFFIPCRSEQHLQQTVAELVSLRLPKNMGIPSGEIQVLTPTRRGAVGTWELNDVLQNTLNPAKPLKKEKKYGNFSFREGDRVMQIRNNYDIMWKKQDGSAIGTGIFNGDIGTITTIDFDEETLTVVFDDRQADYSFDQLGELEPAYAMTVHKSQGSEYRAVVLCAWGGSPYLLSRSVLYTAVTRARELLIVVGREDTVQTMTANSKGNQRYTGLKLRLQQTDSN